MKLLIWWIGWYLADSLLWIWDHLPVVRTRTRIKQLEWQKGVAVNVMWRALDDLETRGDEVAARARLYQALSMVDWA